MACETGHRVVLGVCVRRCGWWVVVEGGDDGADGVYCFFGEGGEHGEGDALVVCGDGVGVGGVA